MTTRRRKPTSSSVTTVACKCSWLEREASEPVSPVSFDEKMGEYRVRHSDGGYSILRHCPWCGGAAPASRRASHFATVSSSEWRRLARLTSKVTTVREAIRAFGKPDREDASGLIHTEPGPGLEPPRAMAFRTLTFSGLSKVADVGLNDFGVDGIRFTFIAKARSRAKPARRPRRRP